MRTSQEWYNEVVTNPALLEDWPVKQYRGEVTAAARIRAVAEKFDATEKAKRILEEIATQEETHATLVLLLLQAQGIEPSTEGAEDRYWNEVAPVVEDFATAAAIGAHAEQMRLERIRVIVEDPRTTKAVRAVFNLILRDEVWHAAAFEQLAGSEAMSKTQYTHEQGRALLGLVH